MHHDKWHAESTNCEKSRSSIVTPLRELKLTFLKMQYCGYGSGTRCLFEPWIRDPEWVKKFGSGSGMNNLEHISESLKTIFRVKILHKIKVYKRQKSEKQWFTIFPSLNYKDNSGLELFLNVERVEEAAGEGDGILGGVHSVDPARRHEECVSCTNPSVIIKISIGTSQFAHRN
jgi:hypothetical protein